MKFTPAGLAPARPAGRFSNSLPTSSPSRSAFKYLLTLTYASASSSELCLTSSILSISSCHASRILCDAVLTAPIPAVSAANPTESHPTPAVKLNAPFAIAIALTTAVMPPATEVSAPTIFAAWGSAFFATAFKANCPAAIALVNRAVSIAACLVAQMYPHSVGFLPSASIFVM